MKNNKMKRMIALLLSFCMCTTLLPISAVALEPPADILRMDVKSLSDIPETFSGHVLTYEVRNDATNGDFIALTVGAYNVPQSNTWSLRLQVDQNRLVPCDGLGSTVDEEESNITYSMGWITCGIATYTSEMLQPTLTEAIKTSMKKKLLTDVANGYLDPSPMFSVEGENNNQLKIDMMIATVLPTNTIERVVGIMQVPGASYAQPSNSLTNMYTLFFKLKQGQQVDSNSFNLYKEIDCKNAGAKSGLGDTQTSFGACFVGFPQPAAVTTEVPFEITATSATNPKVYLTAPANVTITKQDGGVAQSYKSSSAGKLLADDSSALTPESTVALEAGTYDYTVEPTGADTATYATNSGTFTLTEGETATKQLYAKPKGEATKESYSFSLFDGESAVDNEPLSGATVTVDGIVATNESGTISFEATPGTSPSINVAKSGYKTQTGTVTVGAAGTGTITSMTGVAFANGGVVLDQTRTAVTVEANSGAALAGAIMTVTANPAAGKTVTANMKANELPMVAKADASGKAVFKLPNGDYLYTVQAAGFEEAVKSLAIADKITVADADGSNAGTAIDKAADGASGDFTATLTPTAPVAITDPLYYVVGTWDDEVNPTKMNVQVFLKNAKAHNGTFGLKFDSQVFTLPSGGFVKSDAIAEPTAYNVNGAATVANPVSGSGYHAFVWRSKTDGMPVDGTTGAKLLATYTLDLTSAAQNGGYKAMMNSKSLAVAPYTKTAASKSILDAYAADDAKPTPDDIAKRDALIAKHWRLTDAANAGTPTLPRLPVAVATEGGFQQINVDKDPDVEVTDIRAQFVFESFDVPAVTFTVNATPDNTTVGAPIADALVTVKKGETVVKSVRTDEFGGAIIGLPANDTYTYTVSKIGFQTQADIVLTMVASDQNIAVLMPADESHMAKIADSQKTQLTLLGADRAANLVDYTFNLEPKAGYSWASSIPNGPLPTDITVKLGTTTISSDKLSWNADANHYTLAGTEITGDATADLTFSVPTEKIETKPVENSPKITVRATGTGGKFDVAEVVGGDSTFAPAIVTDMTAVVETLGAGKTVSATYTFKEGGPVGGGVAPTTGKYQANVISQVLVNGIPMTITDAQRIHGFSKQLIGVSEDQNITAIYGTATVDTENPDKPIEGGDGDGGGVETSQAQVSVIIGEGGSAVATVDGAAQTVITGYNRASYTVADGKNVSMVITEGSVAQPSGAPVAYEIDQVLVDGIDVKGTSAASWDDATKTVTLSALAKDTLHTVVVTFKAVGKPSNQAVLQTMHKAGNGSITPLGASIYNIGDSPVVDFVPETHWKLGALSLTAPTETPKAEDVMKDVVENAYKVPSLLAGTTTLEYAFEEQSFSVQLSLDYGSISPKKKGFDVVFKRAASAGVEPKIVTAKVDIPAGAIGNVIVEVSAGTWTVVVSKDGYLSYSVSEFTIAQDGTVNGTYTKDGIIYFGKANENAVVKAIKPVLGDATRDKMLIALDDAAQVANGMTTGASDARKERADLDESGTAGVDDMAFVTANFGKRATTQKYTEFIK